MFDGTQLHADETTPPNPVHCYGLLKVVCETVVQQAAQNGAVARVAGVNGTHWARPHDKRPQNLGFGHFCTAVVETLRKGESFPVWEGDCNMVAAPSLASESAEMILRIVEQNAQGVFHCCGGESIGRSGYSTARQIGATSLALRSPTTPVYRQRRPPSANERMNISLMILLLRVSVSAYISLGCLG